MNLVIQYVSQAKVIVNQRQIAYINQGYAVLVGINQKDTPETIRNMAHKLLTLRIIPDKEDKLNLSIIDIEGDLLLIPQFTLLGQLKGHRPNYQNAAKPSIALKLFDQFTQDIKELSSLSVKTGQFGVKMECSLTNLGPITYILED